MTVIAYRDGVLAADTIITTYGGTRVAEIVKIHRCEGWLIGGAGSIGVIKPVMRWIIEEKADLHTPIDFGKIEDSSAILISPNGDVFNADTSSSWVMPNIGPFDARGSGTDAALGAMIMGASAIEAVNVAKQIDASCGGSTVWLSLDGTENLAFTSTLFPDRKPALK